MRKQYGKIRNDKQRKLYRRKLSIRSQMSGTSDRPRLSVFKSNKHLSVQVIDDENSKTVMALNTFGKQGVSDVRSNCKGMEVFAQKLAEKMKEKKVTTVLFDRNGRIYTGVIAKLADELRKNGIQL